MRNVILTAVIVAACVISNIAMADDGVEADRLSTDLYGPKCNGCIPTPPATPQSGPTGAVVILPDAGEPIVVGPVGAIGPIDAGTVVSNPPAQLTSRFVTVRGGALVGVVPGFSTVPRGLEDLDNEERSMLPVADGVFGGYLGLGGDHQLPLYIGGHGWVGGGSLDSQGWALGGTLGYSVSDFAIVGLGGEGGQRDLDNDPEGYTARQSWGGAGPEVILQLADPHSTLDLGLRIGARVQHYNAFNEVNGASASGLGGGGIIALGVGLKSH